MIPALLPVKDNPHRLLTCCFPEGDKKFPAIVFEKRILYQTNSNCMQHISKTIVFPLQRKNYNKEKSFQQDKVISAGQETGRT